MKSASRIRAGFAAAMLAAVWATQVLGGVLSVPQKYQEKDQWCWAACSQANLAFYGIAKSQTEIAKYGTGGQNIPNYLYGGDSTHRGVDMILAYFGGIATTPFDTAFSLSSLTGEINASRPPVIRWGWDGGGGHVVVAHGTDGSTVYLMDPWYGPTVNTYNWVYSGGGHTWTHTLAMNSSPAPTPNPNAYCAYYYAYNGEFYAIYAYYYYYAYDYYGYMAYAQYYAGYARYYAYYAYAYDAAYGTDYGCANYAYLYAYYANLYASAAYAYETADPYSYNAAANEYYAYLYSYLVATGQR